MRTLSICNADDSVIMAERLKNDPVIMAEAVGDPKLQSGCRWRKD